MKHIIIFLFAFPITFLSKAQPLSFLGHHKSELNGLYAGEFTNWPRLLRWNVDKEGKMTASYDDNVMHCFYMFNKYSGKCEGCSFIIRSKELSDQIFAQIEAKAVKTSKDQWTGLFNGKYVIITLMYIGQNRMLTYSYDYSKNQKLQQSNN